MPILLLSLVPVLLNQPLILLPIHIVFLELVFNPISSLVFEAEPADRNLMLRPPVVVTEPLLSGRTLLRALLTGLVIGGLVLLFYAWLLHLGTPTEPLRTAVFTAMVGGNLGAIFLYRRNWFLARLPPIGWIAILTAMAGLSLIVTVPLLARVFDLGGIGWWHYAAILLGSMVVVAMGRIVSGRNINPA